jgi:hypothetical protein
MTPDSVGVTVLQFGVTVLQFEVTVLQLSADIARRHSFHTVVPAKAGIHTERAQREQ